MTGSDPSDFRRCLEYRNIAIRFLSGRFDEIDTALAIGRKVAIEVIRLEKQDHAPAALIADGVAPTIVCRAGQQEPALTARRHDDPSFGELDDGVFSFVEAEFADVKCQCGVVIGD